MTLTLPTTRRLIMMHHYAKSAYKWHGGSEDIVWTKLGHTDTLISVQPPLISPDWLVPRYVTLVSKSLVRHYALVIVN